MSAGGTMPHGGAGAVDYEESELFASDPRIAPGLARPIGWRVRSPDGSQAYDKFGVLDTDWVPVGAGAVGGVTQFNGAAGAVSTAVQPGLTQTVAGALTTFGQVIAAHWTVGVGTRRFFAVDFVNGNDANAGFSDVSMAAAGAAAKKTIAGLAAIFPAIGEGRSAEIAIANGGVNVAQTYADSLVTLLQNCSGYANNSPIVRGTGTNVTAGATAFAGDVADVTYSGGVTGTGMNGAGYNPTGAPTNQVIQCLKVGGAAPGFAAETSTTSPLGWRIRFDSATATVALRNVCRGIVKVAGTDTLTTATTLPAVPAAGDVFYIEMPGVNLAAGAWVGSPGTGGSAGTIGSTRLCGLDLAGTTFTTVGATLSFCAGAAFTVQNSEIEWRDTFVHPVASVIVGGGCRNTGNIVGSAGTAGNYTSQASVVFGVFQLDRPHSLLWSGGSVVAAGMRICGGFVGASLGGTLGGATGTIPCRIIGAGAQSGGLLLDAGFYRMGNIEVTNMGAKPGVSIGIGAVCWQAPTTTLSGSTGNTDVGAQFVDDSAVYWLQANTNTLTGTGGDMRIKTPTGTTVVTWAALVTTGIIDASDNRVVNTSGPLAVVGTFSGKITTDPAVGTVSYMANPGASGANANLEPQRYPTSLRLITRLRVTTLMGPIPETATVTLFKNNVATAMVVNIPINQAQYTKLSDVAHPILFNDGDDFDVRIDSPATGGGSATFVLSATLEGPC